MYFYSFLYISWYIHINQAEGMKDESMIET